MRRSGIRIERVVITSMLAMLLAAPALAWDGEEGPFGLGISAGEPTGVSAKYFFSENVAIDAVVGASFHDETALHIHTDVLWHFDDQPGVDDNPWSAVFGFGFRYKFGDAQELAGIRVPFGMTYEIGTSPFDAFFQFAPILNFGSGEDFTVNVAAGVHYFFK